jgi:hypothetical protein
LIFLIPGLQILLSAAIFGLVRLITAPFGMASEVETLLRGLLFH